MFDSSLYDKTINAIKDSYGSDSITYGSEMPDIKRVSTGSVVLDWLTGGGLPFGKYSQFYGGWGSGKTMVSWNAIAESQKMGYTCAYYDVENQFDPKWVKQRGVDLDKLLVIDRKRIEDIGEIMENLILSVNVHVIDSMGAAISIDEQAASIKDWQMGLAARAWNKALRRVHARFSNSDNMIILINHSKIPFGTIKGGQITEEPAGSRLFNFYSSLNLHFRRSHWLYYDKNGILSREGQKENSMNKDIQPHGLEFIVRGQKVRNATGEQKAGRFRLDFKTGMIDENWTLANAVPYFGLAKKSGSWYTLDNGQKVQGENGLREAIMNDSDFRQVVINRIMEDC